MIIQLLQLWTNTITQSGLNLNLRSWSSFVLQYLRSFFQGWESDWFINGSGSWVHLRKLRIRIQHSEESGSDQSTRNRIRNYNKMYTLTNSRCLRFLILIILFFGMKLQLTFQRIRILDPFSYSTDPDPTKISGSATLRCIQQPGPAYYAFKS